MSISEFRATTGSAKQQASKSNTQQQPFRAYGPGCRRLGAVAREQKTVAFTSKVRSRRSPSSRLAVGWGKRQVVVVVVPPVVESPSRPLKGDRRGGPATPPTQAGATPPPPGPSRDAGRARAIRNNVGLAPP